MLLYQIAVAALVAPLAAWALGEPAPRHVSAETVAALLWQGIAVAGVSYSLWFWVLKRYAAPQLSAFTFISPLVGVFAGWLAFGDEVTAGFATAIALVVAGLRARQLAETRALVGASRGRMTAPLGSQDVTGSARSNRPSSSAVGASGRR